MVPVEPFRVLIVEDEQEAARTIKLLVERRYSATAVIAADCASAREELSTSSFDIIMMDYRLPDGDGLEFLQEINDKDNPPRVIMVTGQGDEQTAVDAFKLGVSGYVVKDMRLSALLADAVEQALFEARLKQVEEALQKEKIFAETILDSLQDVSVVVGVEGGLIRWNRKLNEVTGYSDEEIASMKAIDFFGQEDARRLDEAIAEVVEEGRSTLEASIKTRDGREIPHYHVAGLLKDAEGNLVGICSIARDITERKLAAEALRESEERYQLLASNITDVIWTTDMGLNITFISSSVLNQTGYTADEVLSRSVTDFMTPVSSELALARMKEELGRASETDIDPPVPVELVLERYRKNGTTFWSEERVGFLRSRDGTPYGVLGVSRDITKRKRAEEELERTNIELEGYAQTVSHDLKGPLANIMLGAEMIVKLRHSFGSEDSKDIDEMVSLIIGNAGKANRRIEDVLALAESGQEPRETFPVDVREVVEEVLEERSNVIKEKGIEVNVSGDLGSITANPTQMRQVFSNLIGNAIKYNDSENPVIRIEHLGDDGDSGQRYLVKDNGPGIPEYIIDEVLLPFIKGKGGDTGVGLSIVENIVNVYGGQMRAYNEDGACFEFNLVGFQGK